MLAKARQMAFYVIFMRVYLLPTAVRSVQPRNAHVFNTL